MKKIILILFFAVIFFSINFAIGDPDLWWHLSAGKHIVETGSIPHTDFLSHTLYGKQWIDFEWVFEVIVYKIHNIFGFNGLRVFRSLLVVCVFIILYGLLSILKLPFAARLFGLYYVFLFLVQRPSVRPELFTSLFLSVFLLILEKMRRNRGKLIYLLPFLFIIWVNLHGGYVFGLALLVSYIIGAYLNGLSGKHDNTSTICSIIFCLCIVCGLLNPYGFSVYSIPFQHLLDFNSHKSGTLIVEWQQALLNNNILMTVTFITYGLLMLYKYLRFKQIDFVRLTAFALFSYFGFQYVRNIAVFGLVIAPFIIAEFFHLIKTDKITIFFENKKARTASYALLTICLLFLLAQSFTRFSQFKDVNLGNFPVEACNFIEKLPDEDRMYNSYNYGGYIGWRFYNKKKVFYDGRYIFYPFLAGFENATKSGPKGFNDFLQKYNIDYALLKYPETTKMLGGIKRSVLPFYFPKDKWALVYWDEIVAVYLKRQNKYTKIINDFEFNIFNPDDYLYLGSLVKDGKIKKEEVLKELDRYNSLYPGKILGAWFADYFKKI